MRKKIMVVLATLALALGAAGGALAAGGLNSGGLSTGGGGGGGGTVVACTPVANYVTSTGYVPYGAGITYVADSFTLKSCSGGSSSYTITVLETDASGAYRTYARSMVYAPSGRSGAFAFSNLSAGWDETWTITFTVTDAAGNVVDRRSNTEITPMVRIV